MVLWDWWKGSEWEESKEGGGRYIEEQREGLGT